MESGSTTVAPHVEAPHVEAPEFLIEGQIVLILCGLIASGKSTFAAALEQHFPQFRRCNQDDLGDRRRVEQLARATLSDGQSVCIDRTNFNPIQRSYWIDIAQAFPGTKVWVIVFDTTYEECAARLRTRQNHPTITNAEQGLMVLSRFAADFEHPSPHEGYQKILYVRPEETTMHYTRPDIAAILQRVRDSPAVDSSGIPLTTRQRVGSNRAHRGNRSYRGRRGGQQHAQGRGGLNSASPYDRSNTSRGGRPNVWVGRYGRGFSTEQNHGTTSEIRGEGAGSREDPFGVD